MKVVLSSLGLTVIAAFCCSLFFISFSFGVLRFYIFGHLMTDEIAIKSFPLTVKVNIEQLN